MRRLIAAILGPLVWLLYFALVYGAEAALCTLTPEAARASLPAWSLVLTAAALAALLALGARQFARQRGSHPFLGRAALLLTVLSFIGVSWTALPLALVEACSA